MTPTTMTLRTTEATHAAIALRLLLDEPVSRDAVETIDWDILVGVTAPGALVRVTRRLAAFGTLPVGAALAAVESERRRTRAALGVIAHVTRVCAEHGIACLFPKAYQHYPDMGDDVDAVLLTQSGRVDRLILAGLAADPHRRDLGSRLAGATAYSLGDGVPALDIQHGRLGTSGEDTTFPSVLWAGRLRVEPDGVGFYTAAPEHLLVLHGMQRVFGRSRIDLADMAAVIALLRRDTLAWPQVLDLARELGILPGLRCLLAYAERTHQEVLGRPLLSHNIRAQLGPGDWGAVRFEKGAYRYPRLRVNVRVYAGKLAAALAAGRWGAAARLCLVPLVGVDRVVRSVARSARRGGPAVPRSLGSPLTAAGRRP